MKFSTVKVKYKKNVNENNFSNLDLITFQNHSHRYQKIKHCLKYASIRVFLYKDRIMDYAHIREYTVREIHILAYFTH